MKILFSTILLLIIFFSFTLSALAAYEITVKLPTQQTPSGEAPSTIQGYIKTIYNFSLYLGGFLAMGAIVWGAILIAVSGENPSQRTEGTEWIKGAIFGLILLLGAYLILYTIRSDELVALKPLDISKIPASGTSSTRGTIYGASNPNTPTAIQRTQLIYNTFYDARAAYEQNQTPENEAALRTAELVRLENSLNGERWVQVQYLKKIADDTRLNRDTRVTEQNLASARSRVERLEQQNNYLNSGVSWNDYIGEFGGYVPSRD